MKKTTNWEKEWKCPTMRQRIKPFWFWNGDMNEDEIDRQLREMKEQGLGGAFICARQGQTIAYLNRQWFDRIDFACKKAKEYGLEVWLYDEYPYPSGMGGGEVLLRHPEAAHTRLNIRTIPADGGKETEISLGWDKILYARAVKKASDGKLDWGETVDVSGNIGVLQPQEIYQKTGLTAYNNKRFFSYGPDHVLNIVLPQGKWELIIVGSQGLDDFKYYGNYFDPCNKAAVETFLEITHEKYQETLKDEMGKSVYGMFSDEVGLLGRYLWSEQLPPYFAEKYGYDIRAALAALCDRSYPSAARVRYEYYQALHELFRENYHKTVADWCREHHILYATEVPSMRRSTQIYSTVPGGDCSHEKLGRTLDWCYEKDLDHYRSCAIGVSSVARQMGRDYAMIESFHSIGWSMTLQDAKWMLDLLASMGINFYNVHAFYYTIDSITKHDAPPSQFLQNPYWKNYHCLADYAGRLSAWLSNTESMNNVAILDPVVSYWTHLGNPFQSFHYTGEDAAEKAELETLQRDWMHIVKELRYAHIGFDLLDTEILGMARIADGRIRIGKAEYTTLVLTPNTAIESMATQKIKEFLACGGHVVAFGLLPYETVDQDENVEAAYREIFGLGGDCAADYWKSGEDSATDCRKPGTDSVGDCQESGMDSVADCRKSEADCGNSREDSTTDCQKPVLNSASDRRKSGGVEIIRNGNAVFVSTQGCVADAGGEEEWLRLLAGYANLPVSVKSAKEDRKSLFSSIRCGAEGEIYVFLGNYEGNYVETELTLNVERADAWRMNLENAETEEILLAGSTVRVSLAPYESKLIRFDRKAAGETVAREAVQRAVRNGECELTGLQEGAACGKKNPLIVIDTENPMKVSVRGGNVFRMENFKISLDGKNWAETEVMPLIETLSATGLLTGEKLKYESEFGTPKAIQIKYPLDVYYRTDVRIEVLPGRAQLLLDARTITGEYGISVNGHVLRGEAFEHTFVNDQNNLIQDVTPYLREGENEIAVHVSALHDWDGIRDPLFLIGDFGVENGKIVGMPGEAALQKGYISGFPYYSGDFVFSGTFEADPGVEADIRLSCSDEIHDCLELIVNGVSLGVRAFAPNTWHVKAGILKRENTVEIVYTNTLISMLEGSYFDYDAHETVKICG